MNNRLDRVARATRRAALAASGLVFAALMLPVLLGRSFQGVDLLRTSAGMLCAVRDRLGSGELPWITPLLENGGPLFARPDAQLFYPLRWLGALLPVPWGMNVEVALHFAIAAAATTWLLRTLRVRPFTAACGGIAFALCGSALDLVRHGNYLTAAPWLPLVWAAARRALQVRRQPWHAAVVAAGLGLLLLGAEPQAFGLGVGVVLLETGAALWRWRGRRLGAALRMGVAIAAGLGLGFAQWGVTFGELALTRRSGALPMREVLFWSFGPAEWVGALLPGAPSSLVHPGTTLYRLWSEQGLPYPWNLTPYLGMVALAALFTAIDQRRARLAALAFGVGLLFSLGGQTPLFPLLAKAVPLVGYFRYPAKYLVFTSLAAVVVAVLAFDAAARSRRARRALQAALGVGALALLGTTVVATAWSGELDARALKEPAAQLGVTLPTLSSWLRGAALQGLLPVLLGLVALAVPRLRRFSAACLALDLALAAPTALQLEPDVLGTPSPLTATLAGTPGAVLCAHPQFARQPLGLGRRGPEVELNVAARLHLLPAINACDGVAAGFTYSPIATRLAKRVGDLTIDEGKLAGARALGCTHALLPAERIGPGLTLVAEQPAGPLGPAAAPLRLYSLDEALPEASASTAPRLLPDESRVIAEVGQTSSVEELAALVDDPLGHLTGPLPAGGTIERLVATRRASHEIDLDVAGSGGAVVSHRTAFLVGWSAMQAGHELPTVRVGGNALGAVVEDLSSGPVQFRYRPPNLAPSLLAGILGLCATVGLGLIGRRKR